MIKKIVCILFFLIISFSFYEYFEHKNIFLYGEKFHVVKTTEMKWYANGDIENVSYYMFKDGDSLYCEYSSMDNNFYLCAFKFSIFKDPLFGWVKASDLEK